MANIDRAVGFVPVEPVFPPRPWVTAASQTIAIGDMVALDSAGRVTIATATSATLLGVAATSCTSSSAGDEILVYDDPNQNFFGQCSGNGALTDPYTCIAISTRFDIEGTTGIMEINEDASSYDVIKVIGIGKEPNGDLSAVGANQKKIFIISPTKHQLGVGA